MFKHYVYKHIIGPYIYIGKGTGNRVYSFKASRSQKYKNAFSKYGCIQEILAYFITENDAYTYEGFKILEAKVNGELLLNLTDGGIGIKSYRHSDLTRSKMSLRRRGENNSFYGKTHSEETKEKIRKKRQGQSSPMLGKHHSEETRQKISLAKSGVNNNNYGKPSPMRGKKHSKETREKMSQTRLGEGNSFYGKKHSSQARQQISDKLKGRTPWNKNRKFC